MLRYSRCLAWLCLLWISPVSFGQAITIRVVNSKNGRPLPKRHITVHLLYEKSEKTPLQYDALLQLKTDVHGEARFTLPEPAPTHFSALVRLSPHWRCGCLALVTTQEVIQKGLAKGQGSTGATIPVATEPGEISFAARRRPFFDWLLLTLFAPLME
jgi:hypothetical protein